MKFHWCSYWAQFTRHNCQKISKNTVVKWKMMSSWLFRDRLMKLWWNSSQWRNLPRYSSAHRDGESNENIDWAFERKWNHILWEIKKKNHEFLGGVMIVAWSSKMDFSRDFIHASLEWEIRFAWNLHTWLLSFSPWWAFLAFLFVWPSRGYRSMINCSRIIVRFFFFLMIHKGRIARNSYKELH